MMDFYGFLFIAILLILTPGPDFFLITKNTLSHGCSNGLSTLLGTLLALSCHTTFAVIGLSAIIVQSAVLFSTLKFVGAMYLFYLGITALLAKKRMNYEETKSSNSPFFQGLFTDLLNPKIAVFFLTFLPQFVNFQSQSWISFAILGCTYILATAVLYGVYVLFLNNVKAFMKNEKIQIIINRISGIVLVAFGIKLISEQSS
jgi:threonine/homoserine/homoserine lactone efflux protein